MNKKKNVLTAETKNVGSIKFHRIQALKDFANVKAGDLGGWIEKEENQSHDGNAWGCGNARVYGNANILWISKIGSRHGTTTVFENKDGGISVSCGCFFGTLEEFEKKVEKIHGNNKYGREYKVLGELIKIHFDLEKEQKK